MAAYLPLWAVANLALVLLGACAAPAATAPAGTPKVAPMPAAPIAPAVAQTGILRNPGFESTVVNRLGDPEGWFSFQHAGAISYRFAVDSSEPHGGMRSLRIDNIGPEPYGAIAQAVGAAPEVGKVVRLSGWLKTRDANDGGAALTLLVMQGGAILMENVMQDRTVKGTTGWTRYAITLPVGKGADRVEAGAKLYGRGSLWFDDVVLEFVVP